jgi:hypothetical protein
MTTIVSAFVSDVNSRKDINISKYYLLGKCFNDYSEYEKQLSILRVNNANTMDTKPEYKWNDP